MTEPSCLESFYKRLDAKENGLPEDLLAAQMQWEFSLPDRTRGGGRAELVALVAAREAAHALHRVLLSVSGGRRDLLAGQLIVDGVVTGEFMALALIDASGCISKLLMRRSAMALDQPDSVPEK